MVQWLRTHLPMRGTQVESLVLELRSHMQARQLSPRAATPEPTSSRAHALQLEKTSPQPETHMLQLERKPASSEDPAQPKKDNQQGPTVKLVRFFKRKLER